MQICALIADGAEWEDIVLYPSLLDAQETIISGLRETLTLWPENTLSPEKFDRFHIEVFEGPKRMLPTYQSYRLKADMPPEEWREWILTATDDLSQFFVKLN